MKLAQTVFLKQSFFERHKDHKEILTNKAGRHTDEKKGLPGIDFTKAVVIQQIDIECQCTIDKKEWVELNKNQSSTLYKKKSVPFQGDYSWRENEAFCVLTVYRQHERACFATQDVDALAKASVFHRFLHVRHVVFDDFDKSETLARKVIDIVLASGS